VFEIFNFKKGATVIKSNTAVTNLNVRRISMLTAGETKTWNIYHLTG
jgi:hypothetical protein